MSDIYIRISRLFEGVEAIHKFGIVHRDLKHVNVRVSVSNPEDVTIVDFGEAREIKDDASTDISVLCTGFPLRLQSATDRFIAVFCLATSTYR